MRSTPTATPIPTALVRLTADERAALSETALRDYFKRIAPVETIRFSLRCNPPAHVRARYEALLATLLARGGKPTAETKREYLRIQDLWRAHNNPWALPRPRADRPYGAPTAPQREASSASRPARTSRHKAPQAPSRGTRRRVGTGPTPDVTRRWTSADDLAARRRAAALKAWDTMRARQEATRCAATA